VKPILEFLRPNARGTEQTHDYTHRFWGHDYTFDPGRGGLEAKMMGWGMGIERGDFLVLAHPQGGTTRYRVNRIEYYNDPPDMWRADVVFAPRPTP
jgi:hypothetical protein